MDKYFKLGCLYGIYGGLLTEKQQYILSMFYEEDFSISEIAAQENVSRQAVCDLLHRCEKTLLSYDEKLCLLDKYIQNLEIIERLEQDLKENETLVKQLRVLKENL